MSQQQSPAASTSRQSARATIYRVAFVGVMAAMIYAVSSFPFPLLGSKVHFGNTLCVLAGLLFGPVSGGLAAGIGSLMYDVIHGYGLESFITFASKFAMAAVAGLILRVARNKPPVFRSVTCVIASVAGALTYTALYLLKHFVMNLLRRAGWEATLGILILKAPASLINAVFAMICAPLLYHALRPALLRMPAYRKMM